MRLTPERWEVLKAELEKRGCAHICRECGGKSFELSDCVLEVREFEPSEEVCGVSPIIAMACNGCGNVRFFNAKILNDRRVESVVSGAGVWLDFREKSGK